jgi:hypothetical protein
LAISHNLASARFTAVMHSQPSDGWAVGEWSVWGLLWGSLERALQLRALDRQLRPHTARSALAIALRTALLDHTALAHDTKQDDYLLREDPFVKEDEMEPTAPPLDNFA